MLKLLPFNAPSRYIFLDPDTKLFFQTATKKELFDRIVNYRAQNRLDPIEYLEEVLENFWCSLPENSGRCEMTELKRGFVQYIKGGIVLIKNIFFRKFVDEDTAEKRALICAHCPENVFPDRGPFVVWSDKVAEQFTGGRKTSLDSALGNCEVCSCTLKAKVHYGGKIKLPKDQVARLPWFCWQQPEPLPLDEVLDKMNVEGTEHA